MLFLAIAAWPMGDVFHAASLVERAEARASSFTHIGTRALARMATAMFELMKRNSARVAANAIELAQFANEYDLSLWRAFGAFLQGWVVAQRGDLTAGLSEMRRGSSLLLEHHVVMFDGLTKIALAETTAAAGDSMHALETLDDALEISANTGHRSFDAELHRARGDMLLKACPPDPAAAEQAFLAAIAVANEQGARSFGLRAALSLARLYQSTGRLAEAHPALALAMEDFSPTPELPEIAETQALLAVLGENEEVKAEITQRRRLTRLNVAYGNALFAAHGYGAPETTAAFARARGSAYEDGDARERLAADYGIWVGSYARGELSSMRAHVEAFLNDVRARPDSPEAGIALRICGVTHQFAGEYTEARTNLERALALFQPGRDDNLAFDFGLDAGVAGQLCLAIASWPLGEITHAASLFESAQARMAAITHAGTLANGRQHSALFQLMRRDRARAAQSASELVRLAREHDLAMFRAFAVFLEGWTASDQSRGLQGMRRGADLLREQKVLLFDGLLKIAQAEAEAGAGDPDRAVAIVNEALATVEATGYRAFEAELNRVRGELLIRREAPDIAVAEQALQSAVAVARLQKTQSFELRAALSLAKLYQSTGRPNEGHAVLATALGGFTPTLEMPEIAEAQALLNTPYSDRGDAADREARHKSAPEV
jgi:predicted ATPase